MPSTHLYIGLGSNLGQRHLFLEAAKKQIHRRIGPVIGLSHIFETAPWGFEAEQAFLNQVLCCVTELSPIEALDTALAIERNLGRKRTEQLGYSSRTVDVDLLLFGEEVIKLPQLILPHPQLHKRRFVLEPLAELAPDLIHPVLLQPIRRLLEICEDDSPIHPWPSHTDT